MSEDRLDPTLIDYIDGRLEADGRERFERRLAEDPELGRRLALLQAVRESLRAEEEGLSPGFYTRAVARFEAGRRSRPLPFGLSWSTVGLAAATLAAAAIFIPFVLRDEVPLAEPAHVRDDRRPVADDPVKDRLDARGDFEEGLRTEDKRRQAQQPAADTPDAVGRVEQDVLAEEKPDKNVTVSAEPEEQAESRPRRAREEAAKLADVGATAAELDRDEPRALEAPAEAVEEGFAKAPPEPDFEPSVAPPPPSVTRQELPPPPSDVETLGGSADAGPERSAGRGAARPVETGVAYRAEDEIRVTAGRRAVAVELPRDAVAVGEIEVLDPIRARDRFTASLEKENRDAAVGSLVQARSKAAPETRFVAIGPRPGLDSCSALELRRLDAAWDIGYDDSGSSTGAVACGIEIPDDGVPIRFQGWPIDD